MDVTAAIAFLTSDVQPAIVAVGGALIILAAVAMGFRWVVGMLR